MQNSDLDKVIEKHRKLGMLLTELKAITEVEKYLYCIRKADIPSNPFVSSNYELIEVKTSKLVKLDTLLRITHWLKLRNITSVIIIQTVDIKDSHIVTKDWLVPEELTPEVC